VEEIKVEEKGEEPTIVETTVTEVVIQKIEEPVQEEIKKNDEKVEEVAVINSQVEEIENKEQPNLESPKANGITNEEENKE